MDNKNIIKRNDAYKEIINLGIKYSKGKFNQDTKCMQSQNHSKINCIYLKREVWEQYKENLLMLQAYITFDEFVDELERRSLGVIRYTMKTSKFKLFLRKRLGENYHKHPIIRSLGKEVVYYKKACMELINEVIKEKVKYIKGEDIYYKTIDEISVDDLETKYYTHQEFMLMIEELGEQAINRRFTIDVIERFKVNVICFIGYGKYFYNKEEVNLKYSDAKNYINKDTLIKELEAYTSKHIDREFLKARNIEVYTDVNSLYTRGLLIKRDDLESLQRELFYEKKKDSAKSMFDLFMIKLEEYKIVFNDKPHILKKYKEYLIEKSNKRVREGKKFVYRRVSESVNKYIDVYIVLESWVSLITIDYTSKVVSNSDITNLKKIDAGLKRKAGNQIYEKTMEYTTSSGVHKQMKTFLNEYYKFKQGDIKEYTIVEEDNINEKKAESFDKEGYINMFIELTDLMTDKNSKGFNYKSLVGKRTLTSSVLYVFLNYIFAWRKADIERFPRPELTLLSNDYKDVNIFLDDLMSDKLNFGEIEGHLICKNIELKIRGMSASKNDEELDEYIPNDLYKELGLLLCIAEANLQLTILKDKRLNINKTNLINPTGSQTVEIHKNLASIGIDIEKFIKTKYGNLKATKLFGELEKSVCAELKVAVLVSFMKHRSHKENKNIGKFPSKIGDKHYISKSLEAGTVELVAKGTMGVIKDYILGLVDPKYKEITLEEQIEVFKNQKIANIDIEILTRNLRTKNNDLKKLFDNIKADNKSIDSFLNTYLYGNSYGKHAGVKCALKAYYNSHKDIEFEYKNKSFKCPYNEYRNSCIGCSYIIATKNFIWEYAEILNQFFNEFSQMNDILKLVYGEVFIEVHQPIIAFMIKEYGKEIAFKILGVERYEKYGKEIMRIQEGV